MFTGITSNTVHHSFACDHSEAFTNPIGTLLPNPIVAFVSHFHPAEALLTELKRYRTVRIPRYTLTTRMVDCLPTFAISEVWDSESTSKRVAA
jgi:hypothetical protein